MTTLPKEIEDALNRFAASIENDMRSCVFTRDDAKAALYEVILKHINTGPTQRQRYKEAAINGLLSDSDLRGNSKSFAKTASKIADALLAEDADNANKESAK